MKTIKQVLAKHNIGMTSEQTGAPKGDKTWGEGSTHWLCTFWRKDGRKKLTAEFEYHMGAAHHDEPEADSVMDCLISDASVGSTFEEFCSEFGYDTDSRSAEKTFKACQEAGEKLEAFLGPQLLLEFKNAERL